MIQNGAKSIMIATTNPRGLIYNDCIKWPLINVRMERVAPQDGQGTPVICFIKHTSIELLIA